MSRPSTPSAPSVATPSASPTLARSALLAALVLGVLGDALLREGPSGIGFLLFVVALLVALRALTRQRAVRWTLGATLLTASIVWFASVLSWRDSEQLAAYNVLALMAAFSALAWALLRGEEWEPAEAGVGDYFGGGVKSGASVAIGAMPLLGDARIGDLARGETADAGTRRWPAVARGALVAFPVLVVFGTLFSAADPVFDKLVRETFNIDLSRVLSHVFVSAFIAWPMAGYLRGATVAPIELGFARRATASTAPRLGITEIGIALGALDVLFLLFVAVQLRYLFGGEAHVQATAGVTYAEYARRGFFELVWVTALALGVLIGANGALRRERARDEWVFRALAWTLLGLLAVVMLSALQRMRLYQSAYGLTETRFYATVCMAWLAVVLAWFAGTILRGRGTAAFAFGALVSAWLAVIVLDVANPDAIIARTNLSRLDRGARFDAKYVSALSGDAVPLVAARLRAGDGALSDSDRCTLGRAVNRWRTEWRRDGWRTWNVSRADAREAAADARLGPTLALECVRAPASTSGRGS